MVGWMVGGRMLGLMESLPEKYLNYWVLLKVGGMLGTMESQLGYRQLAKVPQSSKGFYRKLVSSIELRIDQVEF